MRAQVGQGRGPGTSPRPRPAPPCPAPPCPVLRRAAPCVRLTHMLGGASASRVGADNVILARLDDGQTAIRATTEAHLLDFSKNGLRTLCYGQRELDGDHVERWVHSAEEGLSNYSPLSSPRHVRADVVDVEPGWVACGWLQHTCSCRCTATCSWRSCTTTWRRASSCSVRNCERKPPAERHALDDRLTLSVAGGLACPVLAGRGLQAARRSRTSCKRACRTRSPAWALPASACGCSPATSWRRRSTLVRCPRPRPTPDSVPCHDC